MVAGVHARINVAFLQMYVFASAKFFSSPRFLSFVRDLTIATSSARPAEIRLAAGALPLYLCAYLRPCDGTHIDCTTLESVYLE